MSWSILLILSFLQTCSCLTAFLLLQASIEDTSHEDTQPNEGESSPTDSERTITPSQPDVPPSASRKRSVPEPAAPRAPVEAGPVSGPKRARQGPPVSSSSQEVLKNPHLLCSCPLLPFSCRFIVFYIGKLPFIQATDASSGKAGAVLTPDLGIPEGVDETATN